jgi:AcrR family transcriptional regulator
MSAEPVQSEPLPVRDRLLDAAEAVVGRDGVSNLTLEAVAREAGVSKGGLLYHFRSKSELIVAIVERLAVRCESRQAGVVAENPPSPGAFTRAYVLARSETVCDKEPIHTALLAAAATNREYLDPIRRRFDQWQAKIESDGIDPVTAMIVRLAMDGLCLSKLFGMPVPAGEMRQKVIGKLLAMTRDEKAG